MEKLRNQKEDAVAKEDAEEGAASSSSIFHRKSLSRQKMTFERADRVVMETATSEIAMQLTTRPHVTASVACPRHSLLTGS